MTIEKWHRHYGVYGICSHNDSLLVVNKTVGPYKNRYDLPGGTMEPNETIVQSLIREFKEETGLKITEYNHLGFSEFIVPYNLTDGSHMQHIPLFFKVKCEENQNDDEGLELSNDTSGFKWILLQDIHSDNASPLVTKAKEFIVTNKFTYENKSLDDWVTIEVHKKGH